MSHGRAAAWSAQPRKGGCTAGGGRRRLPPQRRAADDYIHRSPLMGRLLLAHKETALGPQGSCRERSQATKSTFTPGGTHRVSEHGQAARCDTPPPTALLRSAGAVMWVRAPDYIHRSPVLA